jgi:glycosyltransferase involved in cell wall biosynthesis/nucleoside phosphorylase
MLTLFKYQLVVVCGLEKECPKTRLQKLGYPVVTLKGLKSGILSSFNDNNKGILFIISGIGHRKALETASYIKHCIKPLFVINIGTAGNPNQTLKIGSWVKPNKIVDFNNKTFELSDRFPFRLSKTIDLTSSSKLKTVKAPKVYDFEVSDKSDNYIVDMEASAFAECFKDSEIFFHTLKYISDFSDKNLKKDYLVSLTKYQSDIVKILSFLEKDQDNSISVVIPTYNRAIQVKQCIESVLVQTLKPDEIIVIDDGSTDSTIEILAKFKEKIIVIKNKKNMGVSYSRNIGIKRANSNWISLLDSDDLWHKDKLKNQLDYIDNYPFYEIMQSEEIWYRNKVRVNACKHHKKPMGWIWEKSLNLCLISPSSVLIKKQLFEDFGYFDEVLPVCEDYDLWLKITRHLPVGLEPSLSLIKYGGHEDQLSTKFPAMDRFRVEALVKALERESNQNYIVKIKEMLKKKLEILIKGSVKREKLEQVKYYEAILKYIDKTCFGTFTTTP